MNELQPQEYRNTCLDRGLLVSLRDGELADVEARQAQAHLAECPDCIADERSMQSDSKEIYDLLGALGPAGAELPDSSAALSAFRGRLLVKRAEEHSDRAAGGTLRPYLTRPVHRGRRRWTLAAAAAILLALIVMTTHVDALAGQFLGLFQPQTFQPVSVNLQTFRNGVGEDLQNFGHLDINAPDLSSITHPTEAQAQQYLSFKLLVPDYVPKGVGKATQFSLVESSEATFTFNAGQARAYLAQTGQGSVTIPPALDGATYTITVGAGVVINYGTHCQAQSQNVNGFNLGTAALGCSGGMPFYVAEIPSPVIRATGTASLEDLRSFLLSLPRLNSSARVLLQDVNLATGVVPLPIPPQIQAQTVTTHGAQGVLMVDSSLSVSALLWQTGGIVYVVAGATTDGTAIMDSANSLH